jgi:hypothetical protein
MILEREIVVAEYLYAERCGECVRAFIIVHVVHCLFPSSLFSLMVSFFHSSCLCVPFLQFFAAFAHYLTTRLNEIS